MLLSATIDVAGSEVSVVLRNLSSEGALIEGATLPRSDARTQFRRNGLAIDGRIVWVEGRFAGLAFDHALGREELLRQVPQPKQRFAQEFRRPGLASKPLSDADRKMLELWSSPGINTAR